MSKRQIEYVKASQLKLAEYNPRTIAPDELERLMTSLLEFGFVDPVIARREDRLVIGGHQRIVGAKALQALRGEVFAKLWGKPENAKKPPARWPPARSKWKAAEGLEARVARALEDNPPWPAPAKDVEVPVVYLDGISDARARTLNLALNRISGEWDYEKLHAVMLEIPEDERDLSGFLKTEIDDLMSLVGAGDLDALNTSRGEEELTGEIDKLRLRFLFVVADDKEAKFAERVLRRFGMTGPGNAAAAFVVALRAAERAPKEEAGVSIPGAAKKRQNGKGKQHAHDSD